MVDYFSEVSQKVLVNALQNGILLESNKQWIPNIGPVSLTYHPQLRRFVLVFGNTAENAGFVLLEDYKKTWRLKDGKI